jgi:hypothetical protein
MRDERIRYLNTRTGTQPIQGFHSAIEFGTNGVGISREHHVFIFFDRSLRRFVSAYHALCFDVAQAPSRRQMEVNLSRTLGLVYPSMIVLLILESCSSALLQQSSLRFSKQSRNLSEGA